MSALTDFLLGIPLLNNLGPVTITKLSEELGTLKFVKGTTILEQGDDCSRLFIVASGKLEYYKKLDEDTLVVMQTISPGEIFGEDFFLSGIPSGGYLRAVTNSAVVTIERATLDSVLKENNVFFRNYIGLLNKKLSDNSDRIETLLSILNSVDLNIPEPFMVKKISQLIAESKAPAKTESESTSTPEENSEEIFYQKEISCPLCCQKYQTFKARHKYTIVDRTDQDSCPYYKVINPMFYEINTCPQCGYSFNTATANQVKSEIKDSLSKTISQLFKGENYCELRSLDDAIKAFQLAIKCQWQMGATNYALGRLFLKLGWLYRYKEDFAEENEQMKKALHHLSKYYDESEIDDPKDEMNVMYLIGQIHLNLEDKAGGLHWFVKITQHKERKKYPYLVNRSSEIWHEIRQELKQQ
ncbi:MAG: DUF2225 domain-containing protein [Peptococcaceae bacterium]|nr:DUF2225 domain-containing protein [Peptococcaceae bacterium]